MLAVLIALLAVVVIAGVVTVLLLRGGGSPTATSTAPGPSLGTPSSSATADATPEPTATTAVAEPPSAEDRLLYLESLQSGNTAAIYDRFTDPVQVVIAASDCCGSLSRDATMEQLASVEPGTTATWSFTLDESTLTTYRAGFYGQYFPVDALVGVSSSGFIASFLPDADGEISTLFMAMAASL
jgi:hypothetical protein